jgi:hypothetical protein
MLNGVIIKLQLSHFKLESIFLLRENAMHLKFMFEFIASIRFKIIQKVDCFNL